MYTSLLRPLLFSLFSDPEDAHRLVISLMRHGSFSALLAIVRQICEVKASELKQQVFGLSFSTPLGLAAGFDKHAEVLKMLGALGFGHIEAGSVTEYAQPGNPRPRMFRLPLDQALINRMGFNNDGAEKMAQTLAATSALSGPLGISLGKSKITPLEKAAADYLFSFRTLYKYGNYFAINVSSPNTPGLRQLQDKAALEQIVQTLQAENKLLAQGQPLKPLLVKIAPDLSFDAIDEVVAVCRKYAVSGIIATNTTLKRDQLHTSIEETGGLSGRPLFASSLAIVRHLHKTAPELPIIGVGGIFSAADAYAFIKAGAQLVQAYTGFIYQGPLFAKHINKGLLALLRQDGFKHISEAVGTES